MAKKSSKNKPKNCTPNMPKPKQMPMPMMGK